MGSPLATAACLLTSFSGCESDMMVSCSYFIELLITVEVLFDTLGYLLLSLSRKRFGMLVTSFQMRGIKVLIIAVSYINEES